MFQLVLVALLRCRRLRAEVDRELANELDLFELTPRPFFLNQFRFLPEFGALFNALAGLELVNNSDVQSLAFEPLRKISVGELLATRVKQRRKSVGTSFKLSNLHGNDI